MNPLKQLEKEGQSVWLDYIRRNLITGGELSRLVVEDGLKGVTSNPTIFEKAIAGSSDYDQPLRELLAKNPGADTRALFESIAIEDIRMAADVLRPVYDQTGGADGFVSIEVAPQLAHDTAATIAEARRLWSSVGRPNLMVKVPATKEGIPAIEALLAEGVNINITLMFSLAHYEAVAGAYISGLARSPEPQKVASVASFFVSRVDTAVDKALAAIGTPEALALQGKIAVANSKKTYQRFREIFYGKDFAALRERGARVQRPLWASTSTKNPAYRDVLYVEELIGKDTVNTMPLPTLQAFRDHGRVRPSLEEGLEDAGAALQRLRALDIDLNAIAEKLQEEGVAAFSTSFDQLLAALEKKRQALRADRAGRQSLRLGAFQNRADARLKAWQSAGFASRLWRKDATLWTAQPQPELTDRLGWLTLPEAMREHAEECAAFAGQVRSDGVRHVVVLGMGGSSLAPDVFGRTFGHADGFPELIVLDSTHPAAVRAVEKQIDLRSTLFVVSSKSGATIEPLSFFRYFWSLVGRVTKTPGDRFAAITDPNTPLERLAQQRGFRRIFLAPPDIGGRYSALSVFGLVPAALIGLDVHHLLDRAWTMAEACASCVPVPENPALALGAAMGELALTGRDKVTFLAPPALASFPSWAEQLIAESTGKDGKGIIPVAEEPLGKVDSYGSDRFFVYLGLNGAADSALEEDLERVEKAGHPTARIQLAETADLGQEFFRWEMAVAAAGAVLGIHPFNQPDVELAKELARQEMKRGGVSGGGAAAPAPQSGAMRAALDQLLSQARPGDYVAIQAYLPPDPATTKRLQVIRVQLRDRLRLATTLGYGPRFLHSTGQLHKGGPNTGLFLQLIDDPEEALPVPETDYSFAALIRAQAFGDYQALQQRGRRIVQIHLGRDVTGRLQELEEAANG
ncbi:MAG TPA: bifunctional transaldolase/phosoglucose isomerase [Bryobacterales bacterium]|nr:bifunctional transaldolase/phosoglucose isomerase [Bryobacterales bacterium]